MVGRPSEKSSRRPESRGFQSLRDTRVPLRSRLLRPGSSTPNGQPFKGISSRGGKMRRLMQSCAQSPLGAVLSIQSSNMVSQTLLTCSLPPHRFQSCLLLQVGYTGVFNVLDLSAMSFPSGFHADASVDTHPGITKAPFNFLDEEIQADCEFPN